MTCGIRSLVRRPAVLVGAALALLGTPAVLGAQSQATTGIIRGVVADPSGNPVANAQVVLHETQTNFTRTLTTDAAGNFAGTLLPLGTYDATARAVGFAEVKQTGIALGVGETVALRLALAAVTLPAVTVEARQPVVDVTKSVSSTALAAQVVTGLPNNGRNYLNLTLLTPNVAIVQGPDGDELTVAGQRGIHNNVSVDGADFNNPFFGEQRGGQRPPFTFNLDAVQEVVVVADGANAEFGRSSSGFVNVVTKSGTNDFHGSGHLYYKADSLAARAAKRGGGRAESFDFDRWQAGFTVGGALQPDRLFYFLAGDGQKGDSTKQTNPARIEQRVVDYFASVGSPDENGSIDRTDDAFVGLAKLDWHASDKHLATLRYAYTYSKQDNGTFDVDSWGRSANATEKDWSQSYGGSLISTLSANLLNELRGQWSREDRPRPYNGPLITGQNRPLPDTAFDFVRAYRFGEPFFIPVKYYDTRTQILDNFSIVAGDHS